MSDSRWAFTHRLTVRFSDCDLFGHVNNAVYFTYFEECRVEWWPTLGERPMGATGFGAIIAHCSCNYRSPAFFGDDLDVSLAVAAVGTSSVTIDHQVVHAKTGRLIADGRTVVVAFNHEAQKTVPVPEATRERLRALMHPA